MSRRIQAVFCLFMVSGFGGLIYESVWTHYLKLFLGHSAYAQTLVLVVFIGGLAAGAWGASVLGGRLANPLRAYAIVELAVGLLALVFHPLFVAATGWGYDVLLPAACAPERSMCAAQWALSALLLAPQSILIGATFPLVSSAVLRMDPRLPGQHISMLYFLNSFGAVIGVIASIFVLIPPWRSPPWRSRAGYRRPSPFRPSSPRPARPRRTGGSCGSSSPPRSSPGSRPSSTRSCGSGC